MPETSLRGESTEALRACLGLLPLCVLTLDARGVVVLSEGASLPGSDRDSGGLVGRSIYKQPHLKWLMPAVDDARRGQEGTARLQRDGKLYEARFRAVGQTETDGGWIVGLVQERGPLFPQIPHPEPEEPADLAKLEEVARQVNGFFWEANPDTFEFTYVSKEAERLLGYPVREWRTPNFWPHLIHPDDRAATVGACRQAVEEARTHQLEYRMLTRSGQWLWVHDFVTVVGEAGRPTQLRGLVVDNTALRREQERLQKNVSLLEATLEATADAIVAIDADGHVVRHNRTFARMWNLSGQEMPEDTRSLREHILPQLKHPSSFLVFAGDPQGAETDGRPEVIELRDGRVLETFRRPRVGPGGEDLGAVWSFRDITARRRAEAERDRLLVFERRARAAAEAAAWRADFLAEASRKLSESLSLETTLDTVAGLAIPHFADGCGLFLFEKTALRKVTVRADTEQLKAAVTRLFERYLPDASASVGMGHVVHTGESILIPEVGDAFIEKLARNAEHLELLRSLKMKSYLSVPVAAHDRTFGVLTCITQERTFTTEDRKLAEELGRRCAAAVEHAQLFQAAQESVRIREDFMAVASHELKTPLTPLSLRLTMLESLLKGKPADDAALHLVRRAQRSVERMGALVEDLLDAGRIDAGKLPLHFETLSFSNMVREMVKAFGTVSDRHELVYAESPGEFTIQADRARIEQVVSNLLDNAIKYTPGGGTIHVTLAGTKDTVQLSVRDPGIGIDPAQHERLFTRFYRGTNASVTHFGGLGLGLYISWSIVQRHGGRIWVESETGRGSTFHVVLPRAADVTAAKCG